MKKTYVPPSGSREAPIIIVGEQPGKKEIMRRKPFIGPAGMELDKCLQAAGIARSDCYLTNVIKDLDYPLSHYISRSRGGITTVSPEGELYLKELADELRQCKGFVIVALGNIALHALTHRWGITNWRGSVVKSVLVPEKKVVPTFHPATVIPPKRQYLNERLIIFDLNRALANSQFKEIRAQKMDVRIAPSYLDIINFLDRCFMEGMKGALINFDIEVYNSEISCISFSYNETTSMSIPFIDNDGDYLDVEQEVEVWKLIGNILEDESIIKLNQNIGFDMNELLKHVGIKTHNVRDTMVCQKILYPDYPAGLDFITTMFTDIPYYKGEGKQWFKIGGEWRKLWHYNGIDSLSCPIAYPKQVAEVKSQFSKATELVFLHPLGT